MGVLAHPGIVDVRIAARAADREEAERLIAPVEEEVYGLLGDNVFARDEETMESVVGGLLREKRASISTYEDLSAGTVADTFQDAAGDLFVQGVTVNSADARQRLAAAGGQDLAPDDGLARSAVPTSASLYTPSKRRSSLPRTWAGVKPTWPWRETAYRRAGRSIRRAGGGRTGGGQLCTR